MIASATTHFFYFFLNYYFLDRTDELLELDRLPEETDLDPPLLLLVPTLLDVPLLRVPILLLVDLVLEVPILLEFPERDLLPTLLEFVLVLEEPMDC